MKSGAKCKDEIAYLRLKRMSRSKLNYYAPVNSECEQEANNKK